MTLNVALLDVCLDMLKLLWNYTQGHYDRLVRWISNAGTYSLNTVPLSSKRLAAKICTMMPTYKPCELSSIPVSISHYSKEE